MIEAASEVKGTGRCYMGMSQLWLFILQSPFNLVRYRPFMFSAIMDYANLLLGRLVSPGTLLKDLYTSTNDVVQFFLNQKYCQILLLKHKNQAIMEATL